jgi:hypothetical protein
MRVTAVLLGAAGVTPAAATPIWVNTPAYYDPPVATDDFEADALGASPSEWSVTGDGVVTGAFNHTPGGGKSVALIALPGGSASMTFQFGPDIQGYSFAILTLAASANVAIEITSLADTYWELDRYDFAAGAEFSDAGLGLAFQETLPSEFFSNWVVFDRSGPLFHPGLGYCAGPSVDHKPTITDWNHPQLVSCPVDPTQYQTFTIALTNYGATPETIHVDDLRAFELPIIAVPVPELGSWVMFIAGFTAIGAMARVRRGDPTLERTVSLRVGRPCCRGAG